MRGGARVLNVVLTIASGQTTSNELLAWRSYGQSAGMILYSPSTLPETVKIEVTPNGTNWYNIQDGDPLADVTVPAAGKAMYFDRLVLAHGIRLVATGAVGADRVFRASFQEVR